MAILLQIFLNLLLGAAEMGVLTGITSGAGYVYQKSKEGLIPAWQLWIFIIAAVLVLSLRKFQPVTWVLDRIRERWHFHLVVFLGWLSLSGYFNWGMPLGLDLQGGSELLYRVRYENLPPEERVGVTQRTIDILERRLNPQGTKELRIQQQGAYRILIQLPGADVAETERDKDRIQRAGRLEFRLVDSDPNHIDAAKQGKRVAGATPFTKGERDRYYKTTFSKLKDSGIDLNRGEAWMLVLNRAYFTGKQLARAHPTHADTGPVVGFEFKGTAKRSFARFTEQNTHKRLAIVLDDVLYCAPVIEERIYGSGVIRGNFTQEEVNNLVVTLRAGSLPADVEMEMENHVGPTLGEDSIRKSITAILIAMAVVLGFMAIYYLAAGCVADFALMLNLILVVGAMSMLSATLTLPGIAGLILTVGMAVDANVLIYERIREEKTTGKALRLIIANGYDRAFTTIFDSNVTTLITSFILYLVGTGAIRGFAVTLSLGIITSMFTGLFVTRWIFEYAREHGWLTEFKMNSLIGETHIPFCAWRKVMFALSMTAIIVGMAAFIQRGSKKYDIDFTGGTRLLLQLEKPMSIEDARERVAKAGYPRAEVQSLWVGGESTGAKTNQFNIRIPTGSFDPERIENIIRADFIEACGGEENVENIKFLSPYEIDLALKKPMSELELRASLASKGYPETAMAEVVSTDAKSSKFTITLKGSLSENDRKEARRMISEGLGDLPLRKKVSYVIGRLRPVEETEKAEGSGSHQLEIALDTAIATDMLEKQMKNLGFENLTAVARGGQKGSGIATRAFLRGSEATLKALQEKGDSAFDMVAFEFTKEGDIDVELKEAVTEEQLRQRLSGAEESLQSIIPIGTSGKNYHIVLKELDETRLRKHICDDLTNAFSDCVVLEKVKVGFKPAPVPADLDEEEKELAENFEFVSMELEHPQHLDMIKDRLIKAGCLNCLVETPPTQEGAKDESPEISEVSLKFPKGETESREKRIQEAFEVPDPFKLVVGIGATVASEMKKRASLALIFAMGAIILYIWLRFGELKYGIAAVLALVHDVAVAMGALAIGDMIGNTPVGKALLIGDVKINLPIVAAFLTIIGYSLNDTIVVFDRIRENLQRRPSRAVDPDVIDRSVNQTLSRTLLTSLTTLVVVVALYFIGGSVIHGFAYTLLIGIVVGTYSSIFIASPILIEWDRFKKRAR